MGLLRCARCRSNLKAAALSGNPSFDAIPVTHGVNSSDSALHTIKKQLPSAKLVIILSDFSGGGISCLTVSFLAKKSLAA